MNPKPVRIFSTRPSVKVHELVAWIVADAQTGIEGVVRRAVTDGTQPLIADCMEAALSMTPEAAIVAEQMGLEPKIARFWREWPTGDQDCCYVFQIQEKTGVDEWGTLAVHSPLGWIPLVTTDPRQLPGMIKSATECARATEREWRCFRYTLPYDITAAIKAGQKV